MLKNNINHTVLVTKTLLHCSSRETVLLLTLLIIQCNWSVFTFFLEKLLGKDYYSKRKSSFHDGNHISQVKLLKKNWKH